MKKITILAIVLMISVVLIGCGGGGSSDTSASTQQSDISYKLCVTKEQDPNYSCLETCSGSTIEISDLSYDTSTLDSCTQSGNKWISDYNKNDEPSTQEQKEGLVWINDIRRGIGLPEFKYSSELEQACLNHENYLGDVGDTYGVNKTHFEDNETYPSNYYTGKFPDFRAAATGYLGSTSEVISYLSSNINESLDDLMSAIYHRHGLLLNTSNQIGFGGTERKFNFRSYPHLVGEKGDRKYFLQSISPDVIVYPFNGQIDVMRVFYEESPDPLPGTSESGYPISLLFNDYYTDTIELSYFKLYKEDGTEVTNILLMNEHNDPNSRFTSNTFALFPMDILNANETYRVEASYILNGNSKSKVWSFTTR